MFFSLEEKSVLKNIDFETEGQKKKSLLALTTEFCPVIDDRVPFFKIEFLNRS